MESEDKVGGGPAGEGEKAEEDGDPSRLEYHYGSGSIGPEGIQTEDRSVGLALGKEADVLAMLRQMGFSEKAIAAFKSGRAIWAIFDQTLFGSVVAEEYWMGKESD